MEDYRPQLKNEHQEQLNSELSKSPIFMPVDLVSHGSGEGGECIHTNTNPSSAGDNETNCV